MNRVTYNSRALHLFICKGCWKGSRISQNDQIFRARCGLYIYILRGSFYRLLQNFINIKASHMNIFTFVALSLSYKFMVNSIWYHQWPRRRPQQICRHRAATFVGSRQYAASLKSDKSFILLWFSKATFSIPYTYRLCQKKIDNGIFIPRNFSFFPGDENPIV